MKIRNANPRQVSGGYARLFNDNDLGMLVSKTQSAVISAGKELESLIASKTQPVLNLEEFLRLDLLPAGVHLATKADMERCESIVVQSSTPDFLAFRRLGNGQSCHVIEVKDGHQFDTKKAMAEREMLHGFVQANIGVLRHTAFVHMCAFNQDDSNAIYEGFKKRISINELLTGRELCELLEIDYEDVVKARSDDAADNIRFFVETLMRIPKVRDIAESLI